MDKPKDDAAMKKITVKQASADLAKYLAMYIATYANGPANDNGRGRG